MDEIMPMLLSEEKRNAMFDSGIFNNIVLAYVSHAMKQQEFPTEDISTVIASLEESFEFIDSAAVMEEWKKTI